MTVFQYPIGELFMNDTIGICNYIQTRLNETQTPALKQFVNPAFITEEGAGYKSALMDIKKGLMKRGLWEITVEENEYTKIHFKHDPYRIEKLSNTNITKETHTTIPEEKEYDEISTSLLFNILGELTEFQLGMKVPNPLNIIRIEDCPFYDEFIGFKNTTCTSNCFVELKILKEKIEAYVYSYDLYIPGTTEPIIYLTKNKIGDI